MTKVTINDEYPGLRSLRNRKIACLSLDLEQDFGDLLDRPSYEGLDHIAEFAENFQRQRIPLTCFVQGSILETHPAQIKELLAIDVDFGLHSYSHPKPRTRNVELEVKQGKRAYQQFFGKDPKGYRSPCCVIDQSDFGVLSSNGFGYDSSISPSMRPSFFNNVGKPLGPFVLEDCGMVEFPLAVLSPLLRIPLSVSYVKLFGSPFSLLIRRSRLQRFLTINFHLHDLFSLNAAERIPYRNIPLLYRKIFRRIYHDNREAGANILHWMISLLKLRGYQFMKMTDVHSLIKGKGSLPA